MGKLVVTEQVGHSLHRELREAMNADRRRRVGERGRVIMLVCECGDTRCHRTVVMTPEQYDAQRSEPILHESHRHTRAQELYH